MKKLLLTAALLLMSCASVDKDFDGIPDKLDQCPFAAEDKDLFDDADGCPELDNDQDGVDDKEDQCPLVKEDRDGYEDTDGCPEFDNDKDGLPDDKDKCPLQEEDIDGWEDNDGCPELDNDQDGINDADDKCTNTIEDKDGFEDEDGCPEIDNDKDGIRDELDKCPLFAEVYNGREDTDGCPDAEVDPLSEKIEQTIKWRTGTSEITFESRNWLVQEIAPKLKAYPGHVLYIFVYMPKIEEMPMTSYLDVINSRSQSIADILVQAGVDVSQLRVRKVTQELFDTNRGGAEDFNANRPVVFLRK